MATCPRCKSQDSVEEKSWDVIPKTGKGAAMRVTAYKCNSCGGKFRKAARLGTPRPAPDTPTHSIAPITSHVAAIPVGGGEESAQPVISSNPTDPNRLVESPPLQQAQHGSLFHRLRERFRL